MLFFMLFEGYLVKMWYIACIPDSGRPDRPTRPDPTRPSRNNPTDRPSLKPAVDAKITFNFAPPIQAEHTRAHHEQERHKTSQAEVLRKQQRQLEIRERRAARQVEERRNRTLKGMGVDPAEQAKAQAGGRRADDLALQWRQLRASCRGGHRPRAPGTTRAGQRALRRPLLQLRSRVRRTRCARTGA